MKRPKRTKRSQFDYRKLEDRICLTVTASVTQTGSLSVRGFSDGLVQINALGNQQFQITDNGAPVATVNGVRQNIVVRINPSPLNDTVRINLLNEAIDNVVVELSDGTNDFEITGNVPIMRVIYKGGSGQDTVVTNVDTTRITAVSGFDGSNSFLAQNNSRRFRYRGGVDADNVTLGSTLAPGSTQAEFAGIIPGDGENRFECFATITENLYFRGGEDRDTVTTFDVNNTASFVMGNGSNVLFLDGDYNRLFVRGGFDTDSVFFDENSSVSQRVGVILFGGNDFVRVDGRFTTDFYFNSTDGTDQVFIDSSALVIGNVSVLLGADFNQFTHNGEIRGDLYVASYNVGDNYRINGTVLGRIRLRPGGQGGGG